MRGNRRGMTKSKMKEGTSIKSKKQVDELTTGGTTTPKCSKIRVKRQH